MPGPTWTDIAKLHERKPLRNCAFGVGEDSPDQDQATPTRMGAVAYTAHTELIDVFDWCQGCNDARIALALVGPVGGLAELVEPAQRGHAAAPVAPVELGGEPGHRGARGELSPPNVRGKVINALMTVTVLAGARGRKPGGGPAHFDPSLIRIDWKA